MQDKHNEEANWEDMDWGQVEPEPAPLPVQSAPAPVIVSEAPKRAETAPPTPVREEPKAASTRKPDGKWPLAIEVELPPKRKPATAAAAGAVDARVFTPSSVATLTLSQEGQADTIVTVKDQLTVGRHKSNDLVIKDLHVSTHHAKLVCLEDGVFEVVDLNSSGGTSVNGTRVERMALESGDVLEFATVAAVFRYVAGPQFDSEDENAGTLMHSIADVAKKMKQLRASQAHATLIMPDGVRVVLPLQSELFLGRSPDCDLVINEEHVSSRHARLVCSGDGSVEVFDLNSTCGTHVNGVAVTNKVLLNGDTIQFGVVQCLFEFGAPAGKSQRNEIPEPEKAKATTRPLPEPKPAGFASQQRH